MISDEQKDEALKTVQQYCNERDHCDKCHWLKELVELRENQEKYKNALEIAVRETATLAKKITGNGTSIEEMVTDGVRRYKKKAGIEAEDNVG